MATERSRLCDRRQRRRWSPGAFARDEDGGMIIFGLFLLVVMLLFAGMSVDFMRSEIHRVRLTQTADRAALAAASLTQQNDPAAVATSYFEAAGLADYISGGTPTVIEAFGAREVHIETSSNVRTYFLKLVGIDELTIPTSTTAAEGVSQIEISLVLDVSGSMGHVPGKLENLQTAAKNFLDIVYSQDQSSEITTSLITYDTQVVVGEDILSYYNFDQYHNYSYCGDLPGSVFDETAMPASTYIPQTGHFDPWSYWGPYSGGDRSDANFVCSIRPWREIVPLSQDPEALKAVIDQFEAEGNTSIDIGMKWAVTLLDPGSRGLTSHLIGRGVVDPALSERPKDYSPLEVMKVIVLMTDGHNTSQYYLRNWATDSMSDVYYDPDSGRYSVRRPEEAIGGSDDDHDEDGREDENYYIPHRWLAADSDNSNIYNSWPHYYNNWFRNSAWDSGADNAYRLSYAELWDHMSMRENAYFHWYQPSYKASYYWDYVSDAYSYVPSNTKNTRLDEICTAAKDAGILVYTIGFEVQDADAQYMEDCATSPSHFFRVAGDEVLVAFATIARQINELALVE